MECFGALGCEDLALPERIVPSGPLQHVSSQPLPCLTPGPALLLLLRIWEDNSKLVANIFMECNNFYNTLKYAISARAASSPVRRAQWRGSAFIFSPPSRKRAVGVEGGHPVCRELRAPTRLPSPAAPILPWAPPVEVGGAAGKS